MGSHKNYFEIQCLKNLTTEMPLLKVSAEQHLEAFEIDSRQMSFAAPAKTCAVGQLINLEGYLCFRGQREKFLASGRVAAELKLDEQNSLYTLELHRYDINLWRDFLQSIEKTQREVDRLFKTMRDSEI
jgi:hypothetical protein